MIKMIIKSKKTLLNAYSMLCLNIITWLMGFSSKER